MATEKSIPIAPVLPQAAGALPDLTLLAQEAAFQSKSLDECAARMELLLAPYAALPEAPVHRLMHGLLGMARALAKSPHGLQ